MLDVLRIYHHSHVTDFFIAPLDVSIPSLRCLVLRNAVLELPTTLPLFELQYLNVTKSPLDDIMLLFEHCPNLRLSDLPVIDNVVAEEISLEKLATLILNFMEADSIEALLRYITMSNPHSLSLKGTGRKIAGGI